MFNRRDFLKTAAIGALGLSLPIQALASRKQTSGYFGLHPFIDNHPEAVFIMPTSIDDKMNSGAKLKAGLTFGRSVFVPRDRSGIPLSISIPVKLNLKTTDADKYPLEQILGTVTDPFFSEGVFEAMKELGISGRQMHIRENDRGPNSFQIYGIVDMANRVGADFRTDFSGTIGNGMNPGEHFTWNDVPNGRWFKKLPQLEPINTPRTWLLNISKFKAHAMGLTLCGKNLQGMVVRPFTGFCAAGDSDMTISAKYRHENAVEAVKKNYARHVAEGIIPRWGAPGPQGGIRQEAWATRTLDNLSVTPCGLNIIEGIYGRDGDSGNNGPHVPKSGQETGKSGDQNPSPSALDFMSNVIIFGRDIFRTDIIGHYLGGHEPGNLGYFHLAMERGMSNALDPRRIPVYLWENGAATLVPVEQLKRTTLLTNYLAKNYGGGTEPLYHMLDEPFDYSKVSGIEDTPRPRKPEAFVLYQSKVNPANPFASIEYRLPKKGDVKFEIMDSSEKTVAVLVEGRRESGAHLAVWNTEKSPGGKYVYRLMVDGSTVTGKLVLQK
ncbi:MAG: DUF362 domain-containing protein [Candidatus Latescibacterota bacterium]